MSWTQFIKLHWEVLVVSLYYLDEYHPS
jgi:hypothetical protein